MKKDTKLQRVLYFLHHYIIFFLLVAFVITCCMMLFVSTLSESLEITFTNEHLQTAAKLTFGNVLLLTTLFTAIDLVRRKLTVIRPIKKIIHAAEKIMQGDFDIRIQPEHTFLGEDNFNPIIECFNQMAEELSGTETLRTDFIANVSHELKTPLAIIQNYETMLQQPGLSEEKRLEYAKSVTDASRRLANLITNILKLNKLENQQIYPATEEYDLSEQLCISLLQFENIWEQKGIDIDTDIEDGITVQADASSDSYQHCFSNWRFPNGMGCNTHCLCSLYIIFLYPFGNNDFVYKSLSRMLQENKTKHL